MELVRIELTTSDMQNQRATNYATTPWTLSPYPFAWGRDVPSASASTSNKASVIPSNEDSNVHAG